LPIFLKSVRHRAAALLACALALAAVLLVIDLRLSPGVTDGLLYLALLGLSWIFPGPRHVVGLGVLSSLLILAGWLFSPGGEMAWAAVVNRLLALLAVWSAVSLLVRAKQGEALAKIPAEDPGPVLRVTRHGRVLLANRAARSASDFFSPADPGRLCERLLAEIADVAALEQPKEIEIPANGRTYSLTLKSIAGEAYLNIYGRDITERARAEAALRERVIDLENGQLILEHQGANLIHLADELKDAREQAESASRAKSQFLATVSHELRTPLNAILGFAQIIKGELVGPVGSERYLNYASDIHQSGSHLLSLINDILDISKVESGNMELREEQIDLLDLINSVARLVMQGAKESGIKLILELSDELPILYADERKVKQVLMNLLSNAIKFSEPSDTVTLKAWHQMNSGFVLQIIDNGIGMAPQDIPKALSQFGQIDSDLNRKYDGTGLGLPLSKSLVELHGGSLDLQSQHGVGTTATVRLPAARTVPVETAQVAAAG
jgi:signal transduction histidine kinase